LEAVRDDGHLLDAGDSLPERLAHLVERASGQCEQMPLLERLRRSESLV
jgi:hypothetical protein